MCYYYSGLPRWHKDKRSTCQCRGCKRYGFDLWVGKIPWRRKWQPTPVFLLREFHGQRSLVDYSPWSHKELDMTACTHLLCFSGMVRPTDQKMIGIEMTGCCSSQEEGTCHTMQGHTEKHQRQLRGRGHVGRPRARILTVVFRERNRWGWGLAGLNNFSRLWGIGAVPSYTVLDPWIIRAGG